MVHILGTVLSVLWEVDGGGAVTHSWFLLRLTFLFGRHHLPMWVPDICLCVSMSSPPLHKDNNQWLRTTLKPHFHLIVSLKAISKCCPTCNYEGQKFIMWVLGYTTHL